jgi:hypothetical protein
MATVYVDEELKDLVQARVAALSRPDDGIIVNERDALVEMLDEPYEREYRRRKS